MDKLKPNFTQFPNVIIDELLPILSNAELKCICYIVRRTYGFQRDTDKISLSQFEKGLISHTGLRLDYGTGISKRSIIRALKSLENRNIIFSDNKYNHKTYGINLEWGNGDKSTLGKNGDKNAQNGDKSTPIMVTKGNIQKKEKESIQNKVLAEDKPLHKIIDDKDDPIKISEAIKEFSEINPACKKMYGNTTQRQAISDLIENYTYEKVISVIRFLRKTNKVCFWKATTPKQLWDNWMNIENEITSKINKELTKKNNII
jgi:phage replication O-like protein O